MTPRNENTWFAVEEEELMLIRESRVLMEVWQATMDSEERSCGDTQER